MGTLALSVVGGVDEVALLCRGRCQHATDASSLVLVAWHRSLVHAQCGICSFVVTNCYMCGAVCCVVRCPVGYLPHSLQPSRQGIRLLQGAPHAPTGIGQARRGEVYTPDPCR